MSGIIAVYHRSGAPVNETVLAAMLEASRERAVDGQATWVQGSVGMAHQHFWLRAEEVEETQPIVDEGTVLSCDARLDNRAALMTALGIDDSRPACGDVTLILAAYRRWGTDCVDHLLGDFCFALWDGSRQHLFAACDALSARSLAYYVDRDRCLIASEIVSILACPGLDLGMNEGKVAELLAGLWDDQEETFYEGIAYCPPAHCLLVTAAGVRKWRYWDVDGRAEIRYRTDGEYAEHYRALLEEAVRCRLRTTGPVGVSLSGGLDSTAVAAIAAQQIASTTGQARLKSFSYVFDDLRSCDERAFIRPVVDRYGLEARCIPCDDLWTLRDLERWPVERDFVLSDPYAWLPQAVTEAAEQAGCQVLLAGYYGDTLFTGGTLWAADMMRDVRLRQLARTVCSSLSDIDWGRDMFELGMRQLLPRWATGAYRRLRPRRPEAGHRGMHPDLARRTGLAERVARSQHWRAFTVPGRGARYRSLNLSLFWQGLAATRRQYNRRGLELELPYRDRRLVEFVMAVPADQLGQPGRDRRLARNALADLLPAAVCERTDRTTFLPLLEKGLLHKERSAVREILHRPQIAERSMIRAEWLEETLRQDPIRIPDWEFLWLCISVELWLERYWCNR